LIFNIIFPLKKNFIKFSAGFGLVGIGALISVLKQVTNLSYGIIRKRYTISLEVVSRDKSYDWLLKWIDLHLKQRSQHISVSTQYEKNENNDRVTTNFSFLPSLGTHYFTYKGYWIRAERSRDSSIDRMTGFPGNQ
jgi:chaperone BCS1